MNPRWASLVATGVLVLAIVALLYRHSLFATGWVAATLQVLAALLMLWARLTFGGRSFHAGANPTQGGLVTSGPYRHLRHPIYSAILFFTWAGVVSHLSPGRAALVNVALAVVASIAIAVRIAAEERLVTERYPEYAEYAARTKRIIPFVL